MEQKLVNKFLASFEDLTGYTATISSDHAYIHKGLAFTAVADLGSVSSTYRIGFTSPTVATNLYMHWRPIGIQTSTDYVAVKLYEDETYTGGSAASIINRNRTMQDVVSTSTQDFSIGVTSTPTSNPIQITGIGSAGNRTSQSGGGSGADEELLLKQNTSYVIEFIPDGATEITFELFWYEETDIGD